MIEKQTINGKDVWIRVDPYHVHRDNPNIIPTEYFTASCFLQEPADDQRGDVIEEDGEVKLFESPVAALSYARKKLETQAPESH
ncbi:MAG: hypothetical protein EON98_09705 [Chitinophagaceae bacterium]|nr:MAG: hypothetical protein EON98_09705 [Chitinophagaceae bacterium]